METLRERPDYRADLARIVKGKLSPPVLKEKLRGYHAGDIAAILDDIPEADAVRIFRAIDNEQLSDILSYVEDMRPWLSDLSVKKQAEVLSLMEEDDAADYLKDLPREESDLLLSLMDEDTRESLSLLVSFSEEEFGSEMSTNYVAVNKRLTVKDARRSLVRQAAENDNISTVYVVDDDDRFFGAVDLKDLIISRDDVPIDSITLTSYPYVYSEDIIEEKIESLTEYAEDSIPVLSEDNELLGVITAQDMATLLGDEMGEDYARLGGLSDEEDLKEPVKLSVRKRFPWLIILLGLGLVVSSVVGLFEGVVRELTIIMAFQSLILDMAGNVGTQSLAVTIRVLMDARVTGRDRWKLVGKEMKTGAVNGLILCVLSTVLVGIYIWLMKGYAPSGAFAISGCIGVSLMVSMVISAMAGTTIPMIFKKMGIDPAVASGPFITTLNDLIAVITY